MSAPSSSLLPVAHLLRPQGRRGELLAEPLSDLPELFTGGRSFYLGIATKPISSSLPCVTIESAWQPTGRNAGRWVLKFSGIDSISAAETLAGQELFVDEHNLPARDADTFLVRDLVGCTLVDNGRPVGTILDVQFATTPDGRTRLEDAAPLLVLQLTSTGEAKPDLTYAQLDSAAHLESAAQLDAAGSEPVLVPFVKAWLTEVDLSGRTVRMTLPEGLLALAEASVVPSDPAVV